jgi:hypothetical protein
MVSTPRRPGLPALAATPRHVHKVKMSRVDNPLAVQVVLPQGHLHHGAARLDLLQLQPDKVDKLRAGGFIFFRIHHFITIFFIYPCRAACGIREANTTRLVRPVFTLTACGRT